MRAIGNFLWFVLGGVLMGLAWWLFGLLAILTVVGIPWAKACLVIGQLTFLPFGREAIGREELRGIDDVGTGPLGLLGNVIWFLLAGWWLALGHLVSGVLMCLTIIGIPLGLANFKLIPVSIAPLGREIVDIDQAPRAGRSGSSAASSR